jgi:hypothetical protein
MIFVFCILGVKLLKLMVKIGIKVLNKWSFTPKKGFRFRSFTPKKVVLNSNLSNFTGGNQRWNL